jgi:2-amino-4-hydroxy-6-hydroxymethyldihydropteridine diphosphokinase
LYVRIDRRRKLPVTTFLMCLDNEATAKKRAQGPLAPYEAQGPDFINAVALVQTQLNPLDLLHALQALELQSGRERAFKNAPRTLDLDLIFYGDLALAVPELTLPHPRWHERAFVLLPLAEIWPERVTNAQLTAVKNQAIQRITQTVSALPQFGIQSSAES